MIINKKICIIGRNINKFYTSGLIQSTHLLYEQISNFNAGITQVVNLFEIGKYIEEIKQFDIIFIDDFITESEDNMKLLKYIPKIKTEKNKIVNINHLFWYDKELYDNLDMILQVKPYLLLNELNNKKIKIDIPIKEYYFQVPDYFQCINGQDRRFENNRFIYVGSITEEKFSIDIIDYLLENYKKLNLYIDFFGKVTSNNKEYINKFKKLIQIPNFKYNSQIKRELLPYYYNNYKNFILFGRDVTSIQSIEQLRCGCRVFMKQRKINNIDVVTHSNDITFINNVSEIIPIIKNKIETDNYNPFEISNRNIKFSMDNYKQKLNNILLELS